MTTLETRWRLVVVVVAAAAIVLSLPACSSSSSDSETSEDTSERAMLDFARCMRDNGVPSFPDPVAQPDGSFGFERPPRADPAALDAALDSCQAELDATGLTFGSAPSPDDPEAGDALLGFSRCMRENGISEFPDPTPSGGFHGLFDGVDLQSPRVQQAVQSCQSFLGQIFGHGGGS